MECVLHETVFELNCAYVAIFLFLSDNTQNLNLFVSNTQFSSNQNHTEVLENNRVLYQHNYISKNFDPPRGISYVTNSGQTHIVFCLGTDNGEPLDQTDD